MKTQELYQSVTARIITDLENGTPPWEQPWKNGHNHPFGIMPFNVVTKRPYSGVNILQLWDKEAREGFMSPAWLTFKQAKEAGGHVRKGEKGSIVVFTKFVEKEDDNGKTVKRPFLRTYTVFNVAQIEKLPESFLPEPLDDDHQDEDARLDHVDRFVSETRADVLNQGNRACFIPSRDEIHMPPLPSFDEAEGYYATLLHELTHWTGHKKRLDRLVSGKFGDKDYAREELVAELGAAFLCAHLGIEYRTQHASYIDHWLAVLKEDNRAIFKAASYASQAATYAIELAEHTDHSQAA